jgi:hypothetical protein
MSESKAPCPCCGRLTLDSGPNDYELCPVCFWEDDGIQLRWPTYARGANGISLVKAQVAYARTGAMDDIFLDKVRPARVDEPMDEGWFPIGDAVAMFEIYELTSSHRWPEDQTRLYWWRPNFWNPMGR